MPAECKAKGILRYRIIITVLFLSQCMLSVLLMLAWMTYNGWTILATCFGLLTGYIKFESGVDDGLD